MNHLYTIVALDIARDRTREADRDRRARLATMDGPRRAGLVRSGLASAFATISRGSAGAARRLDSRVGDDLRHATAVSK
jgi:hypothetical protein